MTPHEPEPASPAGAVSGAGTGTLVDALGALRSQVGGVRLPLALPSTPRATGLAAQILRQLDDYLLPRLTQLDAPLLVVVGGPTGAGKSTIVNSLVRAPVSPAGVLRPTTRAPVLVCHPADAAWFGSSHLLPGLRRRSVGMPDPAPGTLHMVTAPALVPGLALLDAPDVDSVVDANRQLADELLAAADLWLFVTTAARYADAVPWRVLRQAGQRRTAVAVLLDRFPPAAEPELRTHLTGMLAARQLASVPLLTIPEAPVDGQGLLPEHLVAPLRQWLGELARDAANRAAVVRQTLTGAVLAICAATGDLADAVAEQAATATALSDAADAAYAAARANVDETLRAGGLLRGEVLARWREFVATGEMTGSVRNRIADLWRRLGDRLAGRRRAEPPLPVALCRSLVAVVLEEAAEAADRTWAIWRAHPAGTELLDAARTNGFPLTSPDLPARAEVLVRDWRHEVVATVHRESGAGRFPRRRPYPADRTALLVMLRVFASSAVLLGALDLSADRAVTARPVLAAALGDGSLDELTARAHADLSARIAALYSEEKARFDALVPASGCHPDDPERLRAAADTVSRARRQVGLVDRPAARLPLPPRPARVPPQPAPAAPPARSIFALPPEAAGDQRPDQQYDRQNGQGQPQYGPGDPQNGPGDPPYGRGAPAPVVPQPRPPAGTPFTKGADR